MRWSLFARTRAPLALLTAAVLLACSGVVALVFTPGAASAGVTPGIAPDFDVATGDTQTEEFSKVLVGSVEVRPHPDECRTDPVSGLTCAAHRIKLQRTPGANLTIILEWDTETGDTLSVPDVDMFLFDGPTSSFDSGDVGGAGQTMPEQLTIVPEQDEYDLVVQAWAGVVTSYKVSVYYGVPVVTAGDDTVTPDIVLKPDSDPFIKSYTSVLVGQPGFAFFPDGCRNTPQQDPLCDVLRVRVNRNKAQGAINYVVVSVDWEGTRAPAVQTPAVGLVSQPVPHLNMYVYDTPDHSLDGVGGIAFVKPQRVGFIATQDEYDIVIQAFDGAVTGYTVTAFMTDELFDKPYEVLDPVTGQPIGPAVDPQTGAFDPTKLDGSAAPPLSLAPIGVDEQIAGIGLGTTEQFDSEEALRLGREAIRNTSVTSDPPSALVLFLALAVVPAAILGASVFFMRRRHNVAF